MKSTIRKLLFLSSIAFLQSAFAITEHELHVGAQNEQICGPAMVRKIGTILKIANFKFRSDDGIVISGTCKSWPDDRQIMIAAFAYDTDSENEKALVIALLNIKTGKIVGAYHGSIGEDSAMRVEAGSLWIDTAPYQLAPGTRAFGLDVTSGYIANCGDGGWGATRTLYVLDGREIKPVLDELVMSRWRFVKGGNPRCMGAEFAAANPETVTEHVSVSIKLGKAFTNGYRDLLITEQTGLDNNEKSAEGPYQYLLKFDGKKYSSTKSN